MEQNATAGLPHGGYRRPFGYADHKVSPRTMYSGPAIRMSANDHKLTASYGSSPAAVAYRARQQELIGQGRFDDAVQMDIDDIRAKFGSKYDDALLEMIDSP